MLNRGVDAKSRFGVVYATQRGVKQAWPIPENGYLYLSVYNYVCLSENGRFWRTSVEPIYTLSFLDNEQVLECTYPTICALIVSFDWISLQTDGKS